MRETAGDHQEKKDRLLKVIADAGAERLWLTSQTALAWYLDGARIQINLVAPPIVAMLVGPDEDTIFVTDNEVDRMVAEELPDWVQVRTSRWYEGLPDLGSEPGVIGEADVLDPLRAARAALLPEESARFSALGADVAAVLTDELSVARPEQAELDLAAALTGRLAALLAEPLVVLVGGASRSAARHPLPTAAPLGDRAMAVVCARRHGLILNLSRWVQFSTPSAQQQDVDRRILGVEQSYFDAVVPGATLGEVFRAGAAGYAAYGFAADEWERHHQGGAAGYSGRDPRAVGTTDDLVVTGQAFAWNPTALGCKVEDTVQLTADGLVMLSHDPRWPTVKVGGRIRPDVLQLG